MWNKICFIKKCLKILCIYRSESEDFNADSGPLNYNAVVCVKKTSLLFRLALAIMCQGEKPKICKSFYWWLKVALSQKILGNFFIANTFPVSSNLKPPLVQFIWIVKGQNIFWNICWLFTSDSSTKDLFIKNRTKHSNNTLLCLYEFIWISP